MSDIKIMTALADNTRRSLFERIAESPRSVGELVAGASVSQPAVSQHLKVLREAGLVDVERRGAQRIYRLRRTGLESLREWVERCLESSGPKATA